MFCLTNNNSNTVSVTFPYIIILSVVSFGRFGKSKLDHNAFFINRIFLAPNDFSDSFVSEPQRSLYELIYQVVRYIFRNRYNGVIRRTLK